MKNDNYLGFGILCVLVGFVGILILPNPNTMDSLWYYPLVTIIFILFVGGFLFMWFSYKVK